MELTDPERTLAVAYAPAQARPALAALFALDERFGQIVATTTEPMIGLMRLAWWREALAQLDQDPAPAEPLLQLLGMHVIPRGVTGATLSAIEDGWAALIDGEDAAAVIVRHGRERGRRLFEAAAAILATEDDRIADAGEVWALTDLAFHHSQARLREAALSRARDVARTVARHRWPVASRPLAALYQLAAGDALNEARAQGSPQRLLRMLALRITGR
ncbi:MAG TPA: squalene/phytoene synthase family protein [Sphingomonas sp.]|nr:squalene/phytoene synthase family protein [Sphingomonas sp.]